MFQFPYVDFLDILCFNNSIVDAENPSPLGIAMPSKIPPQSATEIRDSQTQTSLLLMGITFRTDVLPDRRDVETTAMSSQRLFIWSLIKGNGARTIVSLSGKPRLNDTALKHFTATEARAELYLPQVLISASHETNDLYFQVQPKSVEQFHRPSLDSKC